MKYILKLVNELDELYILLHLVASTGLTDEQKHIQKVATDFAKNEMFPNMAKWDQEVWYIIHLITFDQVITWKQGPENLTSEVVWPDRGRRPRSGQTTSEVRFEGPYFHVMTWSKVIKSFIIPKIFNFLNTTNKCRNLPIYLLKM